MDVLMRTELIGQELNFTGQDLDVEAIRLKELMKEK
jgi:hypothetical protein